MEEALRRAHHCPESSKILRNVCTSSLRLPEVGEIEVVLSLQNLLHISNQKVGGCRLAEAYRSKPGRCSVVNMVLAYITLKLPSIPEDGARNKFADYQGTPERS